MILVETQYGQPRPDTRRFTVSEAFTRESEARYVDGELEQLKAQVSNLVEMTGRLLEALRDVGGLTDAEVLEVIDGNWEKVA